MVIAIDGPAGAGKSTVARGVAARLGYAYVDSGAMYRAVALFALRREIDVSNAAALESLAAGIAIRFVADPAGTRLIVEGEDVTEAIRTPEVAQAASQVSTVHGVRREMVAQQRRLGEGGNVVMEGRDIGTVVFPQADVKVFLDAREVTRVRRRFAERSSVPYEQVKREIRERDARDTAREHSPLVPAADAVYLDSTYLPADLVVEHILDVAHVVAAGGPGRVLADPSALPEILVPDDYLVQALVNCYEFCRQRFALLEGYPLDPRLLEISAAFATHFMNMPLSGPGRHRLHETGRLRGLLRASDYDGALLRARAFLKAISYHAYCARHWQETGRASAELGGGLVYLARRDNLIAAGLDLQGRLLRPWDPSLVYFRLKLTPQTFLDRRIRRRELSAAAAEVLASRSEARKVRIALGPPPAPDRFHDWLSGLRDSGVSIAILPAAATGSWLPAVRRFLADQAWTEVCSGRGLLLVAAFVPPDRCVLMDQGGEITSGKSPARRIEFADSALGRLSSMPGNCFLAHPFLALRVSGIDLYMLHDPEEYSPLLDGRCRAIAMAEQASCFFASGSLMDCSMWIPEGHADRVRSTGCILE